jgi:hypothetical protein
MCVTCNVPLFIAESPQASRQREYIRGLIDQGLTKEQIKTRLVGEYGEDVLALPEEDGVGLAAYAVPIATFVALIAIFFLLVPRWRRRGREPALAGTPGRPPPPRSAPPTPSSRAWTTTSDAAAEMGGVDTTIFAAFAAGFVSFISPCVLPLVPGYLSAVSGVSIVDLQEGERKPIDVLLPAIVFCLSFTAVFVALGMVATGLGSTLRDNRDLLNQIAGALIVLMGLVFVGSLFVTR